MSLNTIKKQSLTAVLGDLRSTDQQVSIAAGQNLLRSAGEEGLTPREFLTLAIDPRLEENNRQFQTGDGGFLTGYEASLAYLNLPVRDDLEAGIRLRAANDTFQTHAGTRALFPEVIDDMVRWKYRQFSVENVDQLVSQTRQVPQPEILTTVIDDRKEDYREAVAAVAEGAPVPMYSIRTTQKTTRFYKFGSGYEVTYEFARRASLDLLTPYAMRVNREVDISKVAIATKVLIDGDTNYAAAPVVTQASFTGAGVAANTEAGTISRKHLLKWLVSRAQEGIPIDTVVGNWNTYVQWLMLWTMNISGDHSAKDELAGQGFNLGGVPLLNGAVNFALSSTMPDGQLLGYSKSDTLEQTVETGSLIEESQRAILVQKIQYVKTENSGFRLVFGDTRSIYNFTAAG
jgi:hypothetical protein